MELKAVRHHRWGNQYVQLSPDLSSCFLDCVRIPAIRQVSSVSKGSILFLVGKDIVATFSKLPSWTRLMRPKALVKTDTMIVWPSVIPTTLDLLFPKSSPYHGYAPDFRYRGGSFALIFGNNGAHGLKSCYFARCWCGSKPVKPSSLGSFPRLGSYSHMADLKWSRTTASSCVRKLYDPSVNETELRSFSSPFQGYA